MKAKANLQYLRLIAEDMDDAGAAALGEAIREIEEARAEVQRLTGIVGTQVVRKFVGQNDQRKMDELVALGIEQDKREIASLRAEAEELRGMLKEARPAVSGEVAKWQRIAAINGHKGGTLASNLLARIDAAMAAKEGV